mmetsp:Transcript_28643/g.79940  ORF Transcript_28643/g.79940 Transcript_28643/m.79940 type:complete len:222 (-) Transcript_28643:2-667(-)
MRYLPLAGGARDPCLGPCPRWPHFVDRVHRGGGLRVRVPEPARRGCGLRYTRQGQGRHDRGRGLHSRLRRPRQRIPSGVGEENTQVVRRGHGDAGLHPQPHHGQGKGVVLELRVHEQAAVSILHGAEVGLQNRRCDLRSHVDVRLPLYRKCWHESAPRDWPRLVAAEARDRVGRLAHRSPKEPRAHGGRSTVARRPRGASAPRRQSAGGPEGSVFSCTLQI